MPNILLLFKAVRLYIYSSSNFGKKFRGINKSLNYNKSISKNNNLFTVS